MSYTLRTLLITVVLLASMVGLTLVGYRLGVRRIARGIEQKVRGNVVDAAVFGLLGLLLAFSFHGALNRFDEHRRLIGKEVSAIGTLYDRVDLMPPFKQQQLRSLLHRYVQSRIDLYQAAIDPASEPAMRSRELRREIWSVSVEACRIEACPPSTQSLVYGSLAEVNAFPVDQAVMARLHPPVVVFVMLFGLALLCAFLVGYDHATLKHRIWLYLLVYPITMSAIIWGILDLEFPRVGVMRLRQFDQLLVSLRDTM